MKRTLVLTLLALWGFTAAHAQQQFATLQHGDSISAYYGPSALEQAHSAAVAGDIIALSSGVFDATNITKAVIIRGAGMIMDTHSMTLPTIIRNNFYISVVNVNENRFHLEGVKVTGKIRATLNESQFVKCDLKEFTGGACGGGYYDTIRNSIFINCLIRELGCQSSGACYNNSYINSILYDVGNGGIDSRFTNCIVSGSSFGTNVYAENCIMFSNYAMNNSFSPMAYNCVGFKSQAQYGSCFSETLVTNNNCANYSPNQIAAIFKVLDNFHSTYQDGLNYELDSTFAATFLGTDGTQIGIYGGQAPWDPIVTFYKATAATRSTPAGKLEVEINRVNE